MDAHWDARQTAARLPLAALADRLDGDVVTPGDESYAEARGVWNGMVNEYPATVAYCETDADVGAAVEFARTHDVELSVRSGGHSVAGASVVSGGLVVDCSRMNWVRVNPDEQTARVGAGATWTEFDRATQSFDLATPGGVVSDTGVAGLTLGGGTGYLSPKHGLTADNLRAVDVVTGTGDAVSASDHEHEDLFWAARGGGTPGVVTAFEFDVHELAHDVVYVESWVPAASAREALREYRAYQRTAPDEACVSPYYATVPATENFPSEHHGDLALVLAGVYTGDPAAGQREFARFADHPEAFTASLEVLPYTDVQTMFDADFPAGRRYYWKSVPVTDLTDRAIDVLHDAAAAAPSSLSAIVVWPMHGAVARVPADETPVVGRDASVVLNVEAAWDDPETNSANVEWVRETCDRLRDAAAVPGTLPNFAGGEGPDADDVYADHADRLRAVRDRYDPDGVFTYERE
jgi:FAD/FMN-containing dehydrogenase